MVKRNRKAYRNASIYHMRQDGATYKEIAERFEISICRVRQIIEVETAREAAGIYPPFDWNEWNRQNMEKLAKRMEQEAADDSLCKNNSRHIPAASGSSRV